MELQRTVRSHDADRHNFSNNENLWINIQHDPDEARSQLVALRRSVLKLTGEASTQLQLLPGSGACAPPAVSQSKRYVTPNRCWYGPLPQPRTSAR